MRITFPKFALIAAIGAVTAASASAQAILFDFNNVQTGTPLPITLTVSGVTAHLSGTGQGYSIQGPGAPVYPIGFSGNFVYPSSIYPADLVIVFDQTITEFSILYSPEEYGCDDSATMRLTADMNNNFVGTITHTAANPGTWPVDTLSFSAPQGFNSVVIHYDHQPPTCQNWGPIFCADDMRVTPMSNRGSPFCYGDGTEVPCPCGNNGALGHGCENSSGTGGALLTAAGFARLSADTLVLTSAGERPTAFGIFLQGNASTQPMLYGDGLRCVSGTLKRLYSKNAVAGVAIAPQGAEPPISARSLALGDPIPVGGTRFYQVYYRDPSSTFCPSPQGNTWNIGNALAVAWSL
jgi:hypothetical protein